MVIESKLIHFPTEQGFKYAINGATSSTNGLWGIVPDNALAFIDDTHEIWTHGHFYGAKSYLGSLNNGFIQVYNGTVKSTPSLNLWGRYLGPADSSVNGEITIREGAYTAYDENGQPILDKWGMPTTLQSPAKINLMASGFAQSSTGNVNNIGWHIRGPYYESTSNNNYSFSLTYTDASNSEKEYLTLDQYGAMTLSGQGFNVIGKTTVFGGSTTYGLLTSDPGGNIIAQQAYLQGAYLNNTSIVFITNKSINSNWNAIQQYKRNALQTISNDVAYVTAKQHTSPATGWKPWITAASSEFDSWGIGLGGSSFWIGRVANNETENKLTHSWEFDKEGYISAVGYKVNGKDENYVLLGDGSTKPLSEIIPDIDISLITDVVNPGYVLAGPESGEKAAPLFRALVASDIPSLPVSKITGLPSIVTTAAFGYAPANNIDNQEEGTVTGSYRFLGFDNNGVLKWYSLSSNAYKNDNTLYTLKIGTGASATDLVTILSGDTTTSGLIYTNTAYSTTNKLATMLDISTALSSYLEWKGNTNTVPSATKVGHSWRASTKLTIPALQSSTGKDEEVEIGDIIICTQISQNVAKFTVAQTNWSVASGSNSLTWGTKVTLATIGGVNIDATLPTNPNSWRPIQINGEEKYSNTDWANLNLKNGTNIELEYKDNALTIRHNTVSTTITNAATDDKATVLSNNSYLTIPTAVTQVNGHITSLTWTKYKLPYLTSHQNIYNLTIKAGANDFTFQPKSANNTIKFKGGGNISVTSTAKTDTEPYTVTISYSTPTNNVTGSGTSGYLTKWNGTDTITNGPKLAEEITSQTQSTKFLREDGKWVAPSYTSDTHRPIKVNNNIDVLGNNTTALNLVAGSYITLTPEKNASGSYTGKITITSQDTWKAANTSQEGYAPKLQLATTNTIDTQASEYVLTYKAGTETTPVWRKLPVNAFKNDNTWNANALNVAGYVAAPTASNANQVWKCDANGNPGWRADNNDNTTYVLRAGASGVTANQASDVSNPYINLRGSNNTNSQLQFKGSGTVSVKSNNGIITITGTNHITSLAYTSLTGSTTTKNQAIVSNGTVNGWTLKTLGSNAFESHTIYDSTTLVNAQAKSLKNDDWIDVVAVNGYDTGTYVVQIQGTNILASGVFSIIKSSSDIQNDEIPMHNMGTGNPLFARIKGANLQVACTSAGSQTLTIKIKRLI